MKKLRNKMGQSAHRLTAFVVMSLAMASDHARAALPVTWIPAPNWPSTSTSNYRSIMNRTGEKPIMPQLKRLTTKCWINALCA